LGLEWSIVEEGVMRAWAVALSGLVVVGCGGSARTVSFGAIYEETGGLSGEGLAASETISLAIEEINRAGGVLGASIALLPRDNATDEAHATARAIELAAITPRLPLVLGSAGSGDTLVESAVLKTSGILQIATGATAPDLTAYGAMTPLFYRTCPSSALAATVLATRARTVYQQRRIAILHIPNAFGRGLAAIFGDTFTAGGGVVTDVIEYPLNIDGPGADSILNQVYVNKPDAIYLVSYVTDGATIVSEYNLKFFPNSSFWYFTDGLLDSSFIVGVGPSNFSFRHEGASAAVPTTPRYGTFLQAYRARYGKDYPGYLYAEFAYDATYLAALAMEAAGSTDAHIFKDKLIPVSGPPGAMYGPTEYRAAVAALHAGIDIDYDGASGPEDLNANHEVVTPVDVWQIQGGAFVTTVRAVMP
jgi:branched-chain amino acid transport system substrate-binding protein